MPEESGAVDRVRLVGAAGDEPYFLLEPDRPYTFSTAYGTFTLRHEDLHFDAGLTLCPVGFIVPLRLELGIACMVLAMAGLALIRRAAR